MKMAEDRTSNELLPNGQTITEPRHTNVRNRFNVLTNARCLPISIVILVLLVISLGLGYIKKPECDSVQPMCNVTKCVQFLNQTTDAFPHLIGEPFCQFPFPSEENTYYIKCFLPYEGEYLLDSFVYKTGYITRICSITNGGYHFQLQCEELSSEECISVCNTNCGKFKFNVTTRSVILLEMTKSCSQFGGYSSIWNSAAYSRRKKIETSSS